MSLDVIRSASRLAARGRGLVLGAAVALACSACASEEKVATGPYDAMPSMSAYKPPKQQPQVAAASPGSPQPTDGASLTSGMASPPTFTR